MSEIKALDELREYAEQCCPAYEDYDARMMEIADAVEAEIAEKYMELPVDADGVPIHVGDELFNKNKPTDVYKVTAIADNGYIRIYHDTAHIHSSQCRHVKPRTLEDVLRGVVTLCANTWKDEKSAFRYYDVDNVMESGNIADFADEIRAMFGEVDG